MIQKPMKTAFQQISISPVKYQQNTGNLFTKALNRRPSRQFEAPFVQAHPPLPIKTVPLSPIVKGLIPPCKIDYTCDQTFIDKKNEGDNSLFCRQTLATNDTNLFCDEQLKIGPTQKTEVKIKSKNNQQALQANYQTQAQLMKQPPTIPIVQIQYQKIFQKTAVILQNYEQDKRQKQFKNRQLQNHNKQLQSENRSLKQKLRYYERMVVNKV